MDSERRVDLALIRMYKEAEELGITNGVGFAHKCDPDSIHPSLKFFVIGDIEREATERPGDAGVNYLALALSNFAVMVSTHRNSSDTPRELRFGERLETGGLCEEMNDVIYLTGFTGNLVNFDDQVAEVGLEILVT